MTRWNSRSTVLCAAFIPVLAGAQSVSPKNVQKIVANAGTGPYENALQSGLSNVSSDQSFRFEALNDLVILKYRVAQLKNAADADQFLKNANGVLDQLGARNPQLVGITLNGIHEIATDLADLTGLAKANQDLREAKEKFYSKINSLIDQASTPKNLGLAKVVAGLKAGMLWASPSAYQFDSLSVSLGQHSAGRYPVAYFLTGSTLVPINSDSKNVTGRVGTGTAYGNPDTWVATASAATFLSPTAFDGQIGLSYRLSTEYVGKLGQKERDILRKNAVRTLLDHVRPGDLWFSMSARQIAGSSSDRIQNGFVGEAELTKALPYSTLNGISPTTVSLSGIYSSTKALGIDELGAEVRTPLLHVLKDRRAFLSFRYGTRGHFTLALESRL